MEELKGHLDHIFTVLAKGEVWHKKAGVECRKIGVRGMGRFHDEMAIIDAMELFELTKLVTDKLGYYPNIDYHQLAKADTYTINNHADFKHHFMIWLEHEDDVINKLTKALTLSMIDVELYNKIIKMIKCVQNEKFRAKIVYKSLDFAGWSAHDISVKSKWLHKYFEHDYKRGHDIDFNIG